MWKRLLLACVVAILYVLPVAASVSSDSACTDTTFGDSIFTGTVDVEATWTPNAYSCEEGQYLDAEKATCKSCTGSGAYCPGFKDKEYNGTDLGLLSCNSEQDGDGWESRTGATSTADCYKESTIACSDVNEYTGGNGTANYANESVECLIAFNGDRTQCVPVDDDACKIVSLSCADGYEEKTAEDGSLQCVLKTITCEPGTYLASAEDTECSICPEDSFCPGYEYSSSATGEGEDKISCDGLKSPVGSRSENDCGRLLHVGDDALHLHKGKRTEHSLVVEVDGTLYYADTTPVSEGVKPIHPGSSETLRIKIDGVEYSVHETIYE